jgi:hypothetical protein
VNQATEIYSREFDAIISKLHCYRTRITADIRDLGRRLDSFPIAGFKADRNFVSAPVIIA